MYGSSNIQARDSKHFYEYYYLQSSLKMGKYVRGWD